MKIYTYYLGDGIFPLDWEVCFSTVEEYKRKLFEKYTASQEYNDFVIGGFNVLTDKIDASLNYALENFNESYPGFPSGYMECVDLCRRYLYVSNLVSEVAPERYLANCYGAVFGVQARMGTCLHTINRPQAR